MLYILQDTNKIQENRLGLLPKYLDYYINEMIGNQKKIKNNYLVLSLSGYFFKLGVKYCEYKFLNALTLILDLKIEDIRKMLITALENDKDGNIFTSLNSGNIKSRYVTIENFIDYIRTSKFLSFDQIANLICIPKVILPSGINIIIFSKHQVSIRKTLEKEKLREDFYIECKNLEIINDLTNPNRTNIILLKENDTYYPIIMIKKNDENTKDIIIEKKFKYKSEKNNIINHINYFYESNCQNEEISSILSNEKTITSKYLNKLLIGLEEKYHPKYQVIDMRNKCKYIITKECFLIPTRPSGSLYNVKIIKNYKKYLHTMNETVDFLTDLYIKSKKLLHIKPIGVYYDNEINGIIEVNSIMTQLNDSVPIIPISVSIDKLKELGLCFKKVSLTDEIDEELEKGNSSIDERVIKVKTSNYKKESYELFRFELSEYLNLNSNLKLKNKIVKIINDKKIPRNEKIDNIKSLLFEIIDPNLHKLFKTTHNQKGGRDKFIHISQNMPNLSKYSIKNERDLCNNIQEKDSCNNNTHCHWTHSGCHYSLTINLIVEFVGKVSEELAENSLKGHEILQHDNYFVSDIVDYNNYAERPGQKVVKTENKKIKKILKDLFGSENIPIIGKFRNDFRNEKIPRSLNLDNPPLDFDEMLIQNIIPENLTLLRAYVNGYYWVKNKLKDYETRNLGYYNTIQADFANYFRGNIIDWLLDQKNRSEIENSLLHKMEMENTIDETIKQFVLTLAKSQNQSTSGFIELYILYKLNKLPIIVTDIDEQLIYLFDMDNNILYDKYNNTQIKNYDEYIKNKNIIHLRYDNIISGTIPEKIEVILLK